MLGTGLGAPLSGRTESVVPAGLVLRVGWLAWGGSTSERARLLCCVLACGAVWCCGACGGCCWWCWSRWARGGYTTGWAMGAGGQP